MPGQPEGRIVAAIQHMIRAHGGQALKTHPAMGIAGLPDLLICWHGAFHAWEVKQPGKEHTVTARQHHWLSKLAAAGAHTAVVTSVSQARALLAPKAEPDMDNTDSAGIGHKGGPDADR